MTRQLTKGVFAGPLGSELRVLGVPFGVCGALARPALGLGQGRVAGGLVNVRLLQRGTLELASLAKTQEH